MLLSVMSEMSIFTTSDWEAKKKKKAEKDTIFLSGQHKSTEGICTIINNKPSTGIMVKPCASKLEVLFPDG